MVLADHSSGRFVVIRHYGYSQNLCISVYSHIFFSFPFFYPRDRFRWEGIIVFIEYGHGIYCIRPCHRQLSLKRREKAWTWTITKGTSKPDW